MKSLDWHVKERGSRRPVRKHRKIRRAIRCTIYLKDGIGA